MTVRIVAIVGAAQAGKTTISQRLQTVWGYERMRFAGTLKNMLNTMGLTWEQLDGSEKEVPSAMLGGKTPRHAMQTIGTEWRDMIDPNLWTNILMIQIAERIAEAEASGDNLFVIIDDLRFPHEADAVRAMGGEIWCVRRAKAEPGIVTRAFSRNKVTRWLAKTFFKIKPLHPSELHWSKIPADLEIFNNGSQDELDLEVDVALANYHTQ